MKTTAVASAPTLPSWMNPTHITTWAASGPGMVWPRATPFRNSRSVSHLLFSTRSLCM